MSMWSDISDDYNINEIEKEINKLKTRPDADTPYIKGKIDGLEEAIKIIYRSS